jgi:rhomboid family GlyGly-CTERM serine protease
VFESSRTLFLNRKPARTPWILIAMMGAVALMAGMLTLIPDQPVAAFGWLKSASGLAYWRCLSSHFVHLGGWHLTLNLAALFTLAAIAHFQARGSGVALGFTVALLAGMLGVCLGLTWRDAGVSWYVGLSGALYGVYAWVVLEMASPRSQLPNWQGRIAWGLYLAGLIKALLDAQEPVGALGLAGIPLAPPAHLYGFLGGSIWAALRYAPRLRRER